MDPSRCTATSKRSGNQCKRAPINGGTVCAMHGGKAPQVEAKAAERLAEQEVTKALAKLDIEPIGDPYEAFEQATAEAIGIKALVRKKLAEIDEADLTYFTKAQGEGMRAYFLAYERSVERVHKMLLEGFKLGIDERRLRLDAAKTKMNLDEISRGITAACERRGIDAQAFLREVGEEL